MRRKQETTKMTDVFFVNNPMEWPRWPLLPMISLKRKSWEDGRCGFILAEERPPYRVYIGSFFPTPQEEGKQRTIGDLIEGKPIETFETAEAMLKEWRID